MVHSALKGAFPDANILYPPEPDLAVLKGAVVLGTVLLLCHQELPNIATMLIYLLHLKTM